MIYPDDKAAITVFTNIYPGAADAPGSIANRIAGVILTPPPANATALAQAKQIYADLMKGTIDRSAVYAVRERFLHRRRVGRLCRQPRAARRAVGVHGRRRRPPRGHDASRIPVRAGTVLLDVSMMVLPDGKIDQFIVSRAG